jgi:multimeric flavodoxin WrbA
MKVVGIVGSPRRGGNCEDLTKLALDVLGKEGIGTELIRLCDKDIKPCDACRACLKTGKCRIKDDFDAIYRKVVKADGLIISSPVYFGGASPQVVAFISRFYSADDGALENKVGGPIVVARRAGHNFTLAELNYFFLIHGMVVPGSTYWNIAFGRNLGEAVKDEEGVRTVKNFAKKMAWVMKKISE